MHPIFWIGGESSGALRFSARLSVLERRWRDRSLSQSGQIAMTSQRNNVDSKRLDRGGPTGSLETVADCAVSSRFQGVARSVATGPLTAIGRDGSSSNLLSLTIIYYHFSRTSQRHEIPTSPCTCAGRFCCQMGAVPLGTQKHGLLTLSTPPSGTKMVPTPERGNLAFWSLVFN
jgi:hypothetical protein